MFIHDDFLLHSPLAVRLYHEVAARQPIIDYHSHLPPADVAADRRFASLFEIWLEGDHYKWRAMRANGVEEKYCTGDGAPYDKFVAFAGTLPCALRNPLFHWCALELKRYFGIDELLTPATAPGIWEKARARLKDDDRSARGILADFNVQVVCTTDDPADSLEHHRKIKESGCATQILPTFRPDALLKIDQAETWNRYVDRLAQAADTDVTWFSGLLAAFEKRHEFFHQQGCRLSDHGLPQAVASFCDEKEAAAIYDKARAGGQVSAEEQQKFATFIMVRSGELDAQKGWVKQLHLGPLRNNSSRAFRTLGPDTGFDSIGDLPQAERLSRYLDALDSGGSLPRTIIYNVNPADNYVIATMTGNFMDGKTPGKVQFGSGWWFLDQKDGMEWQINALSNIGLLSRWVGMLTDSRSFMSFPRHEYFRRILCNLLGEDVRRGELPDDFEVLADLVRNICYGNAQRFFGFLPVKAPLLA
ncbi:MAG TPA: glucuronate isomerase [Verrucomicrobiales bacterium]|nr:glucuronate isomerase [Verrucomicrobiales bacterium]